MKKQFIAGAVCSQCGAVDSIVVMDDGNGKTLMCVDCDHQEALDSEHTKKDTQAKTYNTKPHQTIIPIKDLS